MTALLDRLASRARLQAFAMQDSPPAVTSTPFVTTFTATVLIVVIGWFLVAAGGAQTRAAAQRLDERRGDLRDLQIEHRHLVVERALLRSPTRLRTVAAERGLTAPAQVVHLEALGSLP